MGPKKVLKLVQSIEKKAKRPEKTHTLEEETDVIREWDEVSCTWNTFSPLKNNIKLASRKKSFLERIMFIVWIRMY